MVRKAAVAAPPPVFLNSGNTGTSPGINKNKKGTLSSSTSKSFRPSSLNKSQGKAGKTSTLGLAPQQSKKNVDIEKLSSDPATVTKSVTGSAGSGSNTTEKAKENPLVQSNKSAGIGSKSVGDLRTGPAWATNQSSIRQERVVAPDGSILPRPGELVSTRSQLVGNKKAESGGSKDQLLAPKRDQSKVVNRPSRLLFKGSTTATSKTGLGLSASGLAKTAVDAGTFSRDSLRLNSTKESSSGTGPGLGLQNGYVSGLTKRGLVSQSQDESLLSSQQTPSYQKKEDLLAPSKSSSNGGLLLPKKSIKEYKPSGIGLIKKPFTQNNDSIGVDDMKDRSRIFGDNKRERTSNSQEQNNQQVGDISRSASWGFGGVRNQNYEERSQDKKERERISQPQVQQQESNKTSKSKSASWGFGSGKEKASGGSSGTNIQSSSAKSDNRDRRRDDERERPMNREKKSSSSSSKWRNGSNSGGGPPYQQNERWNRKDSIDGGRNAHAHMHPPLSNLDPNSSSSFEADVGISMGSDRRMGTTSIKLSQKQSQSRSSSNNNRQSSEIDLLKKDLYQLRDKNRMLESRNEDLEVENKRLLSKLDQYARSVGALKRQLEESATNLKSSKKREIMAMRKLGTLKAENEEKEKEEESNKRRNLVENIINNIVEDVVDELSTNEAEAQIRYEVESISQVSYDSVPSPVDEPNTQSVPQQQAPAKKNIWEEAEHLTPEYIRDLMYQDIVPRPQQNFANHIDNSERSFVPRLHEKPHAITPLDRDMYMKQPWLSPYQTEIQQLKYSKDQVSRPQVLTPFTNMDENDNWTLVDTVEALQDLIVRLSSVNVTELAVDLENNSYRSYQGFLCLMQLSTRTEDFIVDVLKLREYIPNLARFFADPSIVKVFHGADNDILWLQRDFGIYVVNMFDTGQAARALKYESYSLAYLLERFVQIKADKSHQTSDWRKRPISEDMLRYARQDTHYLLSIYDRIRCELLDNSVQHYEMFPSESGQLLTYVLNRSATLCLRTYAKETVTQEHVVNMIRRDGWRLGIDTNSGQNYFRVAASLYVWRDSVARIRDESTEYVLPNVVLLAIAKHCPTSLNELREVFAWLSRCLGMQIQFPTLVYSLRSSLFWTIASCLENSAN